MLKKSLYLSIPFLIIFLLGLALLLRPQYSARVIEVVNSFTRREKTSPRSTHRHTVHYSTVRVEFDGEPHDVVVRDHIWIPVKAGDIVTVTKDLSGKIVEYRTGNACLMMLFSAFMGPVCLLLSRAVSKRKGQ